jgi:Cu(I)/Ag(I) efflux system membrane protein CusA/SilA
MMALQRSNADVGGQVMEIAGHEHVIRGRGYVHARTDLEEVPLRTTEAGVPVRVKDIGEVVIGQDIRRGLTDLDGEGEVPGGIVIMRYGENALDVIDGVKARLAEIQRTFPEGVQIVATYDRSELIRASIDTLQHTLIEEMIVVALIIFLFLLHVRSALIPILTLPLGILLAFIPMAYQHLTANIMSLGGIAVAIGAMVDASIIIIENIHRKLDDWERHGRPGPRLDVVISAMQEVGPSVFFSLLVITVSFIPVFTLEGTEGRLFKPLAFTKTYSMGFAAVLAVTLTPALAAIFVRGKILREDRHPVNRLLTRAYAPVVRWAVRYRGLVIVGAALVVVLTIPVWFRLSSEFMPPLNEGAILYMPTAPPGMSIAEASHLMQVMDRELKSFPEVASVFGKNGRAETPTDPDRRAQAARSVAPGDDVGSPGRRDGQEAPLPGHAEHLLDADPDPHRDALDWHPQPARHRGVRRQHRSDREGRGRDRARRHQRARNAQRVRRSLDRRFLHRSGGQPRRRCPARAHRGRRRGRHPDRDRRDERVRDRRGSRALLDQLALRARVPR